MTRRAWLAALAAAGLMRPLRAQSSVATVGEDLTTLGLVALREQLRRGACSPRDVVEAYLGRIEVRDADLHAYVTVTADLARQRARQLTSGANRDALLFGMPLAHKDLLETAGVRTTAGSRLFEHRVPKRDAAIVAELSAAGAILLGKTNTHELGGGVTTINPFFGTTRNPRDRDRIAGGSSGGSAAAVADRLAVAATGTDTGGSIRIPAALCGCVGFKPTFGLLSTAGVLGAAPTFDHAGFLARTAADLGPLLGATLGVEYVKATAVPASALTDGPGALLRGVRVGVPRTYFFADVDDTVGRAMEAALGRLERAGARVTDVRPPVDDTTMARVFDPIVVEEIHQTYGRDWRERPALFSDSFAGFFRQPRPAPADLERARRAREAFQAAMGQLFDEVDVLAMPAVPVAAPRIDGPIDGMLILRNTWPFNAARLPALTLPCGQPGQLPAGLQLVAGLGQDARLVQLATLVEMAQ